jgi:hypothetical protein
MLSSVNYDRLASFNLVLLAFTAPHNGLPAIHHAEVACEF